VPVGYKRTEVGLIPEDWDIMALRNIIEKFVNGGTPSTKNAAFWSGNIPWITGADILNQTVAVIRRHITEEAVHNSSTSVIAKGNLLIVSRTGVGKLAIAPCDIAISQDFTGVIPNKEKILAKYLFRHFDFCQHVLAKQNQGTSIKGITRDTLAAILIPLPPLSEQRAIAEALSDMDGLLAALEALIAKKQAIKQATMQQLLTGKTRLPGFREAWETRRLGDTFTCLPTANNPRADLREYGQIGYIHYGDVHAHAQPVLSCAHYELPWIDKSRVDNAAHLQNGDLVMVDASEDLVGVGKSIEIHGIAGKTIVAGLHTILCRGNPDYWAMRFKAYLQFIPAFKSALIRMATGISVYAISKKQLSDIELALPSLLEQEAIVSVLSDMDAEIAALERRRDKTRAVKQGMMQQLLTGRVRLVEPRTITERLAATRPAEQEAQWKVVETKEAGR
ncbi:MAG: restriction endonuclease subunit S, partial [Nitrospira sp. SB0667_bin_9]|nr:restriction endonuclease subunit S [Nitrospira sp. SB0667_bin_9]